MAKKEKKFKHNGSYKTFKLYQPLEDFPGDSKLIPDKVAMLKRKGLIVKKDKSVVNGKSVINFYIKSHESKILVNEYQARATINNLESLLKDLNKLDQLGDEKTWKYKSEISKAKKFNDNIEENKKILKWIIGRIKTKMD